ncbi:MAG TPA: hypothetical protein VNC50_04200 [Planctomycetia bacterium]|nr:hypothetical protein [Planctomycetia bacterium]
MENRRNGPVRAKARGGKVKRTAKQWRNISKKAKLRQARRKAK